METAQGRGAGATAYSEEAVMDKMEVWEGEVVGREVSAKELVVAREGKKGVRSFANTPAGHGELIQTLTRGGSGCGWLWKRPGCTGWMWRSR